MGLDGGTIISRSDVLRGSSWRLNQANSGSRSTRGGAVSTSQVYHEPQLDQQAAWRVKWGTCALSEQPLRSPVVADRLGSLYNREAVLEWVLSRRGAPVDAAAVHRFANQIRANGAALEHLASMKDVFAVALTPDVQQQPGAAAAPAGTSGGATDEPQYACPITGLPCGRYTMVALVPCGHIVSQRALDRLGAAGLAAASTSGAAGGSRGASGSGSGGSGDVSATRAPSAATTAPTARAPCQCPVCGAPFVPGTDDVIINGSQDQVLELRWRLEEQKRHRGDGSGKRKRDARPKAQSAGGTEAAATPGEQPHQEQQRRQQQQQQQQQQQEPQQQERQSSHPAAPQAGAVKERQQQPEDGAKDAMGLRRPAIGGGGLAAGHAQVQGKRVRIALPEGAEAT